MGRTPAGVRMPSTSHPARHRLISTYTDGVERLVPRAPAGAATDQPGSRGGWAGAGPAVGCDARGAETASRFVRKRGAVLGKVSTLRTGRAGRGLLLAHPQFRFVRRAAWPRPPLARSRAAPDPATDSATGCRYLACCLFFWLGVCPGGRLSTPRQMIVSTGGPFG